MAKRYFFCGDILGFSKIIKNLSQPELENKIQFWVDLVDRHTKNLSINKFQLLSDTIFVAVEDDGQELKKLVNFIRNLMSEAIIESLPIRGAITYGEFHWDDKLVYGDAVIRAHEMEKNQNWIGICLDSSIKINDWKDLGVVCYPVPMHCGPIKLYPALSWDIPTFEELTKFLLKGGLSIDKEEIGWNFGNKIGNTILFRLYLQAIKDTKANINKFHGYHPVHFLDTSFNNR